MGDEHDRHPVLPLQLAQKLQDLGLRGHVERRRRLVCDQQGGMAGQRHRDHRPLAQSPAQLIGQLIDPLLG